MKEDKNFEEEIKRLKKEIETLKYREKEDKISYNDIIDMWEKEAKKYKNKAIKYEELFDLIKELYIKNYDVGNFTMENMIDKTERNKKYDIRI